jgi:Periplasmic binding protein
MAVADFGGKVLGKPIEVVFADHQNKADIGASIAREWFDVGKVDMVIDFDNSSVALAVEQLAKVRNRRHAVSGPRFDADGDVVHLEVDRCRARSFGEAEQRIGHEVLRVPGREIAGEGAEQLKLLALGSGMVPRRHDRKDSAARLAGVGR